jgi:hypothetical protein
MKRVFALLMVTAIVTLSISGEIRKSEESFETGVPGLEGKKVETETDWKPDGSGEWLKPNHTMYFCTTNGKAAEIAVVKEQCTLNNCKIVYSKVWAPRNGDWSGPIQVEAIQGDKPWSYNLVWRVTWR